PAAEADALIAPQEQELRERLGANVYGADEETLESVVVNLLRERSQRVATAESVTGGLLAARLTAVVGSAEPFAGGYVAEAIAANASLLGVPEALIREHGMVSAPVVEALAEGARRALDADYGLAVTGMAGLEG